MADTGLKIVIGADVSNGVNGLNSVSKALAKTAIESVKTTDALARIAPGANQAGTALSNVGRLAQDLPFGFIGVQNNLNPLLESFQRLKAELGSTKLALKALASSLAGAGGLGLALSVVSSAILIYQNGIAGFSHKTKEAKDEAQKLAETLKSVKSAIDVSFEGEGSAQSQIIQVKALAAAVGDETRSQIERGRAIEQLKKINKEYFGDLKLQEDSLRQLTPLVNEYTNAIIQQAIVSELSSEIGKLGAIFVKQKEAVRKAREELDKYKEGLGVDAVDKAGNRTFVLDKNIDNLTATFTQAQKTLQPTAQKFNDLAESLRNATQETLRFKSTNSKQKAGDDGLNKQLSLLEKIRDAQKDFQGRLFDVKDIDEATDKLAKLEQQVGNLKLRIAVRDAQKAGLPAAEIARLKDAIKLDTEKRLNEAFLKEALLLEFSPKLKLSRVNRAELPGNIESVIAKATGLDKKIPVITLHEARIKILGSKLTTEIEGKEQILADLNKQVASIFEGGLNNAFSGIGEAFGEALASGDIGSGLKKAAENVLGVVGDVMQQLGKAVIAAAIKIKLLKEALKNFAISNPALAVLAGITLVAAGAALKNIKFDGPKFAEGGIVSGPMIGQVGERFRPEIILPLDRLPQLFKQIGGDVGGGMQMVPIINNEGLFLAVKRGERSAGRKF